MEDKRNGHEAGRRAREACLRSCEEEIVSRRAGLGNLRPLSVSVPTARLLVWYLYNGVQHVGQLGRC